MAAKQEVPLITTYIYANRLIFRYIGFDMCRIQWRHLFYNSTIQYGRQTGSAIDYNLYFCKRTNLSII